MYPFRGCAAAPLIAIAAVLLLTACSDLDFSPFSSPYPIQSAHGDIFDPALLGVWTAESDDEYLEIVFETGGSTSYHILFREDPDEPFTKLAGFVGRLDNIPFLNVTSATLDIETLNQYLIYSYQRVLPDTLILREVNFGLDDSPPFDDQLQFMNYLSKYALSNDFYEEEIVLRRRGLWREAV